jgi:hypothetical protein
MLYYIIRISIISIILIFLIHYLIVFFKNTLTVPKIKDLVNTTNAKYEKIYDIIKNNQEKPEKSNNYTLIDLLPKQEEDSSMKNELKSFLKKQLQNSTNNEFNLETNIDFISNNN